VGDHGRGKVGLLSTYKCRWIPNGGRKTHVFPKNRDPNVDGKEKIKGEVWFSLGVGARKKCVAS